MKGLNPILRAAAIVAALWITAPAVSAADTVDVNRASVAELVTLKGIGPVYAERIVDYRAEHGRFDSVQDLTDVQGIGDQTVAAIREQIDVGH